MRKLFWYRAAWVVLVSVAYGPAAHAHWPDQPPHRIAHLGEFKLEGGGVIDDLKMSYVTHGKLNATDNAILRAADICAAEPQRAARFLSDKLYEPRFQIGLAVMKSAVYNRWREADPEDTIRFHALRLHEVGMIQSSPQKLIAQGTNWRFLNELKKELKA